MLQIFDPSATTTTADGKQGQAKLFTGVSMYGFSEHPSPSKTKPLGDNSRYEYSVSHGPRDLQVPITVKQTNSDQDDDGPDIAASSYYALPSSPLSRTSLSFNPDFISNKPVPSFQPSSRALGYVSSAHTSPEVSPHRPIPPATARLPSISYEDTQSSFTNDLLQVLKAPQ